MLQKVPAIQLQCLETALQPVLGAGSIRGRLAQLVKRLHIQGEGDLTVPGVAAPLADDEDVSGRVPQPVQGGAHPVEHGLQSIGRIGHAIRVVPQQSDQLLLGYGALSAVDHIGQQQPHLAGAVVAVVDLHIAGPDGESAQHVHF